MKLLGIILMNLFANRKSNLRRRLCKRVFNRPSSIKASSNGSFTNASSPFPFISCESLFVKCKKPSVSSVAAIFSGSHPSTILRRVISVIVDSVNLMLRSRSWPHICKKVFKRKAPSFTNTDSTCPIIFVALAVLIMTTSFHAIPDVKFWGFSHAVCSAVGVADGECVSHTNGLNNKTVIFNKITKKEGY